MFCTYTVSLEHFKLYVAINYMYMLIVRKILSFIKVPVTQIILSFLKRKCKIDRYNLCFLCMYMHVCWMCGHMCIKWAVGNIYIYK